MKITPNSLTIAQLLGSENEQYVIPAYQRRYSWKRHQVEDLWDDLRVLEERDTHLLGTIVCLTGQHAAGINRLELVDGQQRLATISILLYCLLQRLKREGRAAQAHELERLLKANPLGGGPQPKVALDSLDARQFELHVTGTKVESVDNPRLADAFEFFNEWLDECDLQEVETVLYRLRYQANVIRLDVSEAKDAFKLFETINNRGLRLSPTDIIKNFILGNAARFGQYQLEVAKIKWAELLRHLDGISTETFFRQFMVSLLKSRVTKSSVVKEFQSSFMKQVREAESLPDRGRYYDVQADHSDEDEEESVIEGNDEDETEEEEENGIKESLPKISFTDFLDQLVGSSKTYREIVLGLTGKPKIDRRLRNLRLIKSLQSYGFLMTLRAGKCSDSHFEEVLQLTEVFLLRRHICRERTNDNETVFARLCAVDPANPLDQVRKSYREYCPIDEKFNAEFATAKFNSALIDRARYCLEQIEMHQHGDYLELIPGGPDTVHVEHIIPQKIKTKRAKDEFGDWPAYLGANSEAKHPQFVSRIGNLSLFSGTLNIGASNNPYKRKKEAYIHSAIKITKSLPTDYHEFRFAQVAKRSVKFADLAVKLWPIP